MTLDDFFPFIMTEVDGVPDPTVRARLLLVAADFCRRTLAWTELQEAVPLVSGQQDYEIDKPSGAYAYTVLDVLVNGVRLTSRPLTELQNETSTWSMSGSNAPVYYNASIERGSVRLFPIPTNITTEVLQVRAAYVPTLKATTLPDFLGTQHMDTISSGTKAHLMMMPAVGWSNPQLGAYYQQRFEQGLLDARIEELHDRVPGSLTVRPRAFGF